MHLSPTACLLTICTVWERESIGGAGVTSDRNAGIIRCADVTDSPVKPGCEVIALRARHYAGTATMIRETMPLAEEAFVSCAAAPAGVEVPKNFSTVIAASTPTHPATGECILTSAPSTTAGMHRIHKR